MEKYWTVLQDYAFALVDANDTAMEILGAYEPNGPKEIHNVELSERLREKNKFNFKTEMEVCQIKFHLLNVFNLLLLICSY